MTVSHAELSTLASSHDIIALGIQADEVRKRLHGRRTTYVRVAEIPAALGAAVEIPAAAGEVRIVGTPASRADAIARVKEVSVAVQAGTPFSAFSLADLETIAARESITLRTLLEELAAAGLELVSEAPYDLLQNPHRAIEEVNIGGLALARLTVDRLPDADPLAALQAITSLQRIVGVIRAFAPLPRRVNPAVPTTGYDDVKRIALARVIVTNIPSIQVDWNLYGPKLAQVALTMGADDVDGVSAIDDESQGPRRTTLEDIRRNIRAADLEPVERNGRFDLMAAGA
jgi:2-iminoacetate synthase ThiH